MFSRDEIEAIEKANFEVLKFFCFIHQFIIVLSIDNMMYLWLDIAPDSATGKRFQDCTNIAFSVSAILMLYGFSNLIKKALKTQ